MDYFRGPQSRRNNQLKKRADPRDASETARRTTNDATKTQGPPASLGTGMANAAMPRRPPKFPHLRPLENPPPLK
jgi:hypothetical protein